MQLPYRFGRYTLLEKIAAGGTAEVYRAVRTADNGFAKTLAIKRLLPSWGANDEIKDMLIDEARALVCLEHQAIVSVLDLGNEEGMPFIAMEYIDGIDCARLLNDLMRSGERLPVEHALYIVSQLLWALEFAHRTTDGEGRPLKIVHRDISPSNILLSWNGEVKVTDFGIAKGIHRTRFTAAGQLRGKYAYMAPEQARGKEIDARADLFACGIVMCELLTGRRLFDATTDLEVIERVKEARYPAEQVKFLPVEIRAVLVRALAGDITTRYQKAGEMLSDVQGAARATESIGSSLELAAYLKERYPDESRARRKKSVVQLVDAAHTKVMESNSPNESHWHAARHLKGAMRAASIVLLLGMCLGMTGDNSTTAAEPALSENAADVVPASNLRRAAAPKIAGAIVIDSSPSGANGKLVIGDKVHQIATPFSKDDLTIGDGIAGSVELTLAGHAVVKRTFRLTQGSPSYVETIKMRPVRKSRISVNARPWGYVSIPGLISKRETPVTGLIAKAGNYTIQVVHPPSERQLVKKINLSSGRNVRCIANFDNNAKITCN